MMTLSTFTARVYLPGNYEQTAGPFYDRPNAEQALIAMLKHGYRGLSGEIIENPPVEMPIEEVNG